jgi:RNA polymerase sigma-70 factor (ECF subfamily)
METESDEIIVQKVVQGDTQSYGILLKRYERPVFNLMYRYCRSDEEAADLCQDVFLKSYERLSSFDCERKFFPWLYTLAMNRAKDWQRKNFTTSQKLARFKFEMPLLEKDSSQETQFLKAEEVKILYGALSTLSRKNQEILLMRYRQERPVREVASVFKISESAAKMRISRALQQLKDVLGGKRDER